MKILLINTSDHAGGAAIASLRLLKALRAAGADAQLLCRDRLLPPGTPGLVSLPPSPGRRLKFALERLEIYLRNGCSKEGLWAVDTARLGNALNKLPVYREADVIHLHWTNQAMLSLRGLRHILRSNKRVVWTMHDMWPFTGICHVAGACEGWRTKCGNCPQLRHPHRHDLSSRVFKRKMQTYAWGEVSFVGCSRWMAGLAASAPLLRGQEVVSIPNPLDTAFYAPAGSEGMPSKAEARRQLGLPEEGRLLLFAAYKATDPKKGIYQLQEAADILCHEHPELRDGLGIALTGRGAESLRGSFPFPAYPMGYTESEERMRLLYQAADLLVSPTLADNLPNTIAEAMACGVPCVAYGVGGVPQMIDTGINGYLARPADAADFARSLAQALTTPSYAALARNARATAVQSYSEKNVAAQYMELYRRKPRLVPGTEAAPAI